VYCIVMELIFSLLILRPMVCSWKSTVRFNLMFFGLVESNDKTECIGLTNIKLDRDFNLVAPVLS